MTGKWIHVVLLKNLCVELHLVFVANSEIFLFKFYGVFMTTAIFILI